MASGTSDFSDQNIIEKDYAELIRKLSAEGDLPDFQLQKLIKGLCSGVAADDQGSGAYYDNLLFQTADSVRRSVYGDEVYLRGLIELTNYCKNN